MRGACGSATLALYLAVWALLCLTPAAGVRKSPRRNLFWREQPEGAAHLAAGELHNFADDVAAVHDGVDLAAGASTSGPVQSTAAEAAPSGGAPPLGLVQQSVQHFKDAQENMFFGGNCSQVDAKQALVGCRAGCTCRWYKQCYPRHHEIGEDDVSDDAGVCGWSMKFMSIMSFSGFTTSALAVIIVRMTILGKSDRQQIAADLHRIRGSVQENYIKSLPTGGSHHLVPVPVSDLAAPRG